MKQMWIAVVLAMGLAAGQAWGADEHNAGESVAQMKARLVKLKAEVADLEAKIQAAEAETAGKEPQIVTQLNAMPHNIWAGDSDSSIKQQLRDKWVEENLKAGTNYTFSGTVINVSPYTISAPGKASISGVAVTLDCGKHSVLGKDANVKALAVLENVSPADTVDWGDKKTITIEGPGKSYRLNGNNVEVQMAVSKKK